MPSEKARTRLIVIFGVFIISPMFGAVSPAVTHWLPSGSW